jgi:hypothetical protein
VYFAVELDDTLGFDADEINNKKADGVLATKLNALL